MTDAQGLGTRLVQCSTGFYQHLICMQWNPSIPDTRDLEWRGSAAAWIDVWYV